jgi:hypothetical protein
MKKIFLMFLLCLIGCQEIEERALIEITYDGEFYVFLYISNKDINHLRIVYSEYSWSCDEQYIYNLVPNYNTINIRSFKVCGDSYQDAGDLVITLINGNSAMAPYGMQGAIINYIK